jgi:hypothetical protein
MLDLSLVKREYVANSRHDGTHGITGNRGRSPGAGSLQVRHGIPGAPHLHASR